MSIESIEGGHRVPGESVVIDKKYPGVSEACHVDKPRCRLCGGVDFVEANANGDYFCGDCQSVHQIRTIPDSVCGPVDGARKGEFPLTKVEIGPEYKNIHELSKEKAIEELKRLVEKFNNRPATPEQERVCREFGEAWVRGIAEAMARPGLIAARPMCEFCEKSLGEKHHAHYLCPQSDDGKTMEWRLYGPPRRLVEDK